jgi:hypothetical protein
MFFSVQRVGKQLLNSVPAKLAGRQADTMNYQQANGRMLRTGIKIR